MFQREPTKAPVSGDDPEVWKIPDVEVAPLPCIKPCIVPLFVEPLDVTLKFEVANLPLAVSRTPLPPTTTPPELPLY